MEVSIFVLKFWIRTRGNKCSALTGLKYDTCFGSHVLIVIFDRQTGFPKEILLKSYREAEEKQKLLFQNICENILFKNVL